MRTAVFRVVGVLLLACGPVKQAPGGTTGGTSSGSGEVGSTATPTSTAMVTTSEGASTQVGTSESQDFVFHPDIDPEQCDLWQQDCPVGQKCVAHGGKDFSTWEVWKCVPVVDDAGGPNEPCTVKDGWNNGEDTCAKGLMCWYVGVELTGVCVPLCTGSVLEASCPEAAQVCGIIADNDLTPYLCYTQCDPLAHACPKGQACYRDFSGGDAFFCEPTSGAQSDEPFGACVSDRACADGLVCLGPAMAAVECGRGRDGCCTPYCDLDGPQCPGAGQACVPWFDDPVPPEYADLGVCLLP